MITEDTLLTGKTSPVTALNLTGDILDQIFDLEKSFVPHIFLIDSAQGPNEINNEHYNNYWHIIY